MEIGNAKSPYLSKWHISYRFFARIQILFFQNNISPREITFSILGTRRRKLFKSYFGTRTVILVVQYKGLEKPCSLVTCHFFSINSNFWICKSRGITPSPPASYRQYWKLIEMKRCWKELEITVDSEISEILCGPLDFSVLSILWTSPMLKISIVLIFSAVHRFWGSWKSCFETYTTLAKSSSVLHSIVFTALVKLNLFIPKHRSEAHTHYHEQLNILCTLIDF